MILLVIMSKRMANYCITLSGHWEKWHNLTFGFLLLNSCCRIRGQLFSKLTLLDQLLNIIRMIIKRYEKWSYDLSCMLTCEKFISVVYTT